MRVYLRDRLSSGGSVGESICVAQARLYTSSPRIPLILSAPPPSLHTLYLSPALSRGGGTDTPMCCMNEKYKEYIGGIKGTSKGINAEKMSVLMNLHILPSKCIIIIICCSGCCTLTVARSISRPVDPPLFRGQSEPAVMTLCTVIHAGCGS